MASLPTSPTLLSIKPDPTLLFFFPLRPPKTHYPHFSLLPRPTNTRISTTVTLCSSSSSGDSSNPLSRTTPANFTASSNGDYLFVGESSPDDGAQPARVVDDWGETAEPETGPTTKLSDADPPKEEDEWGQVVVDGAPAGVVDEWGESGEPETEPPTKLSEADPPRDEDEWGGGVVDGASSSAGVVDEWGERGEPAAVEPATKLSEADPPRDEDEWGGGVGVGGNYFFSGDGGIASDKLMELKRCLVDTVYGTDFGFGASAEVRAEALELVSQLEAANPTPAPAEAVEVLDGNWVLV